MAETTGSRPQLPHARQEIQPPQSMHEIFDRVLAQWKDQGPALGHLPPEKTSGSRQLLTLAKTPASSEIPHTTFHLDMVDEGSGIGKQLAVEVGTDGKEKVAFQIRIDEKSDPIQIKLEPTDIDKLIRRLFRSSRWGKERILNPYGYLDMQEIPDNEVLERLQLSGEAVPGQVRDSISKSSWRAIDGGRVIVEIRNPAVLKQERKGLVYVTDADDTLFSATKWHKREFEYLSTDHNLTSRNATVPQTRAKEIYDMSKILIPGKAEQEPRYTPRLNIALITAYSQARERGLPDEQAMEAVHKTLELVEVARDREEILNNLPLDEDVLSVFNRNKLSDFLYRDYVSDIFAGTQPEDLRIIATRGTVEGPLGQVHKLHQTGILDLADKRDDSSDEGGATLEYQTADIVIYTNDLKAETLTLVPELFPYLSDRTLRIYDDNPSELTQYHDWAKEHSLENLEMIQVRHPDAKRREAKVEVAKPLVRTGTDDDEIKSVKEPLPVSETTIYDIYFPYPDSPGHGF